MKKLAGLVLKKFNAVLKDKIYLKISVTFLFVSGIITLITKNEYWMLLSIPFILPFFTMLILVSTYLIFFFPYIETRDYLQVHKISFGMSRLIAFLVQIGVLTIVYFLILL